MEATQTVTPGGNVTLYRFQKDPMQFCTSPYANKLDALFTFSALKNMKYAEASLSKAPRGKIPYIDLDGTTIPDSEFAYDSCIEKGLVECLDRKVSLSEKETAISRSMRSLIERDLYDAMVYERWIENWYLTRDKCLAPIPALIRAPVGYLFVYRKLIAQMWGAGIARLSSEERQPDLEESVRAVSILIPNSGYIMGKSTPTRIDATAFGYLESLFSNPELSPKMTAEVHKYPHILDYRNRLVDEFWPQRKQIG